MRLIAIALILWQLLPMIGACVMILFDLDIRFGLTEAEQ